MHSLYHVVRFASFVDLQGDRFIPNRGAMNFDASHFSLTSDAASNLSASNCSGLDESDALSLSMREEEGGQFRRSLAANLLPSSENNLSASADCLAGGDADTSHRVLAFKAKAPAPADGHSNSLKVLYSQNKNAAPKVKSTRHIPSAPDKILDAPDMCDDFYLNLLDWSVGNMLAVALGPTVYLWNATSGSISELMRTTAPDDFITSVSWIKEGGGYLAIGTNSCDVQLWDVEKSKQVRSMKGHTARVGALDWSSHVLSSGSRDSAIFHHDVRVKEHHIATLLAHTQEVCGLKWSPDGTQLASGGNDNMLCIWDASMTASNTAANGAQMPRYTLTDHQAAVKAMAWCPWQKGLLASGGGTADRCIKLWNSANGSMLNSIDTGSQVCALQWNPHERELLSSHGFAQNQLCLWKYPSMVKIRELTGHTQRVLHLAPSPDGSMVCSAGADETLRFWRIFGEPRQKEAAPGGGGGGPGGGPGPSAGGGGWMGGGMGIR